MVVLRVDRERLFRGYGVRNPFGWVYKVHNEDGSTAEFSSVDYREHYRFFYRKQGKGVTFNETWKSGVAR